MIKRRFYRLDHGDRDASDPSSSDSDSEIEAESTEESEDDAIPEVNGADSTSSGYKSEDSSAKDIDVNSSGLLFSDDDAGTVYDRPKVKNRELPSKLDTEVLEGKPKPMADEIESLPADASSYVLKCKTVFKCRICPRIICLTENTLRDHLQSKRHARSEKLLSEGRLKAMLNSNGEIEELEVSDSEIQAKDTEYNEEKSNKGQKQKKKKFRKKKRDNTKPRKMKSTKGSAKKRRKNDD